MAVAAAEEARVAAEIAAEIAAVAVEKLEAARQTPDLSADSIAIPERSAAVVFSSTVSTEAAEHPFLGLSPSDSLGSLESLGSLGSLGSQQPPRPTSSAESKASLGLFLSAQEAMDANRAKRNSVAAQDWAIKRRQQMERAARIKGERAFAGRSPSAASSTGTPPRSPAVLAAANATPPSFSPAAASYVAIPEPAQVASHGAIPVPRATSRSLSGALQAAAPPPEPQQPQPPPPQLTSRRHSSPAEDVFVFEEDDALSNASSSYTSLASSRPSTTTVPSSSPTASIDDWRTRRQARLAKAAHTPPPRSPRSPRSPRRLEAQRAELSTSPACQPSSPLRPGSTCSAPPRSNPHHTHYHVPNRVPIPTLTPGLHSNQARPRRVRCLAH